jgi:hypothetical protein
VSTEMKELKQAEEERDYWNSIGEPLGLRVHGWSYKDSALFIDSRHNVISTTNQLGWMLELSKKVKSLER